MRPEPVLDLLRALCRGLCPGGIDVVAHDSLTAFAPAEGRIMVARSHLSAPTPVSIGAVMHEIGHVFVSRYHLFARPADASALLWGFSQNAMEESRVHCFLRRRLGGVNEYLNALFATVDLPEADALESDVVAFLAASGIHDRIPRLPFLGRFPAAAACFRRTADARARYARTLPPAGLAPLAGWAERYARSVAPLLREPAGRPDPSEAEILCAAASARTVFVREIWPEIMALAERDRRRIARALAGDSELLEEAKHAAKSAAGEPVARRALRAVRQADERSRATGLPDAEATRVRRLASGLFDRYLEARLGDPPRDFDAIEGGLRVPGLYADVPDDEEESDGGTIGDHGEASDERQTDQDALVHVLRRALPPRPRLFAGGHRAGPRLDLAGVMRAAAVGRDMDRIWLRRVTERPYLAVLLLVDLSGSMRGKKIEAAIAATRAITAAVAKIRGVSCAVVGFQDITIPVIDFNQRAGAAVLSWVDAMREEVRGTRERGNNHPAHNDDGPCLLEAASILAAVPGRDRLLIVISDGQPEGCRSNADDLRRAVATVRAMSNMTLVGIGIGPGTEHVTQYYPVSRGDVPLPDLAGVLGSLIATSLEGAAV
ncbi:MAG: VWA domain-containing protein [Acidisphaera sp.]|nr:VWA domain-containing protein [Acidisphaera sp.]